MKLLDPPGVGSSEGGYLRRRSSVGTPLLLRPCGDGAARTSVGILEKRDQRRWVPETAGSDTLEAAYASWAVSSMTDTAAMVRVKIAVPYVRS